MANKNHLFFILILFIISISIAQGQNSNENTTKNNTKSFYDYEDDEQEEDRKKGKNETHILILSDLNYSAEISKYESLFLIFYLSPCEGCKLYMPHFIRLSHYSYDFNLGIKFAKLDGKINEEMVKKYKRIRNCVHSSYENIIIYNKR